MLNWVRKINDQFISYYLIVLFFLLWQVAPVIGWANPKFIPPVSKVLEAGWVLVKNGDMYVHIAVSLERVFIGLFISIIIGLPLGFILGGWLPKVAKYFEPFMNLCAQINTMTLLPLFLILFGVGEGGKYSIIFWASFWPILFTTMEGVKQVDPLVIKCAKAMGVNGFSMFFKVFLPGAAMQIFTGIRTGTTMAFMLLIGAEWLGANMGLGWLIRNSEDNWQIPRLYLGILAIAVIGLIINYFLVWLENTLITWRETEPESTN
ncbi:MAG TPA: ABC transporter permease [Methylomusa anaerophila]|uniref:Putative aliphatic sulfonates transport permease protein SsuC n=1 Tax=Methylomusa anaerophila TaxID=1930071 RepID=A0A348AEL8_9FIRM|nr:ABC transporter permease [Methylomusa anaerophila]BBB89516.1 putative aliphatic sulfonates transport permease protein SsuC [Methylomusa anaerophila]HML90114.1 ABC transporter permease [Methylomusa anaerophila]